MHKHTVSRLVLDIKHNRLYLKVVFHDEGCETIRAVDTGMEVLVSPFRASKALIADNPPHWFSL